MEEFSKYEYIQLTETEGFSVFKELYGGYLKNGDTEKFYEKYYAQVPLKSTSFFRGLSQNAATSLAIKVAHSMLSHCNRMKSSPVNSILSSKTKNVSKDVLHSFVNLYIRVRSFSLTKDIIQDFKIKTKQAKGKALRKEIQRSCHEHTQERQN